METEAQRDSVIHLWPPRWQWESWDSNLSLWVALVLWLRTGAGEAQPRNSDGTVGL